MNKPARTPLLRRPRTVPHLLMLLAVAVYLVIGRKPFLSPDWIPLHDTLTQYTEFLYALSAFQQGELPLWNSYLYGGQPFYLLLNHGLLLNPLVWIWFLLGAIGQLHPTQIFAACHVSEVLLFALGGYAFVRTLTRSAYAGAVCFLVLLFCGEASYWKIQTYPLAVIEYLPWILFFLLRYIRTQSLAHAIAVAVTLGIAGNSYYPSYLIAFFLTIGPCVPLFYEKKLRQHVDLRRLMAHGLIVAPLLAFLLLPTYLSYHEITSDFYQISRYNDVLQQEPGRLSLANTSLISGQLWSILRTTLAIDRIGYHEAVPLVGSLAVTLALFEVLSLSRRGLFGFTALLLMLAHYAGNATPFPTLANHAIPFYSIIRSASFFSGYVILCLSVLAAFGALRLAAYVRRSFLPGSGRQFAAVLGPGLLLVLLVPPGERLFYSLVLLVLGAIVLASGPRGVFHRHGFRMISAAVVSLLLVVGASNQWLLETYGMFLAEYPMFSYDRAFSFEFVRPQEYLVVQPRESPVECCSTNYHIAEKLDGPHFFGNWGSPQTLFVSKKYYHSAAVPGADVLMHRKLWSFSACTEVDRIDEYRSYLKTMILPVTEHGTPGSEFCRSQLEKASFLPEGREPIQYTLLYKTANDVGFSVTSARPIYLLYTDTYHDGFIARVDGAPAVILKGMGFLKAVKLEPGKHDVEFLFRPVYRFVLLGYLCLSVLFMLYLGSCVLSGAKTGTMLF